MIYFTDVATAAILTKIAHAVQASANMMQANHVALALCKSAGQLQFDSPPAEYRLPNSATAQRPSASAVAHRRYF